ncbi:hypothetical protein L249_3701 [Ophiocordyceps polyrhachis-furcata BCC 54312]|uniref:Leucine carboxyl methyltransferase 1 n=1 Tax=Ophiocordyceps polyrhachis-furcata BCC 54312 TaxID=1330021 RepID=A0A367L4L6_9HYPO|nr:hypothetical protein L249_3701 [Ophiocordyceps polyrhachis-furcata BCC 54312]
MAAPSIPNLLSLRGDGGRRGRNRRGRGDGHDAPPDDISADDAVIQDTDTDAAVSRLSAVQTGYLCDRYAESFVSGPARRRRQPIINRGTYVRTRALDLIISSFLSHDAYAPGRKQVVSLGAGTDTRPFRLLQAHDVIYHEIDFEATCRRKYNTVSASPSLAKSLQDVETAEGGSWSARWCRGGDDDDDDDDGGGGGGEYHCHAVDLRHVDGLDTAMGSTIRTDLPTLMLSECCLCYLSHEESKRVVAYFESRMDRLALAVYEPMPLRDPFGRMMLSNLGARRIQMPSAEHYRDAQGQEARLRDAGFHHVGHATVEKIWDHWVGRAEKARLDALEGLDELEEWRLLAAHYVVAWGTRKIRLEGLDGRGMAALTAN